jgi:hypothetical protein
LVLTSIHYGDEFAKLFSLIQTLFRNKDGRLTVPVKAIATPLVPHATFC